jgi:potassium-transporting ATPase KdpC subunit
MIGEIVRQLRTALVLLAAFTLLFGLAYPMAVTAIAHGAFPTQAHGSLIPKPGGFAGSELIGQPFSDPQYFWSRPSATTPFAYNAASSSGSNLGPTNPDLTKAVSERVAALREADRENPAMPGLVPVDLVTASGSGLDPDISPAAANYQVNRVARERRLPAADVQRLVAEHTENRQYGFLGEPRVNVLRLNLALDELTKRAGGPQ